MPKIEGGITKEEYEENKEVRRTFQRHTTMLLRKSKEKIRQTDHKKMTEFLNFAMRIGVDFGDKRLIDRLVIPREGTFFSMWDILITILCIVSAYVYMFIAAFGVSDQNMDYLDIIFNFIFFIDMILRFCLDYYDKIREETIKTQPKLAMHYLKGDFLYDFVATVPFLRVINSIVPLEKGRHSKVKLLYLIKIIRISKLN